MKIAVGNDHAGFPMAQHVIDVLTKLGAEVTHHGCYSPEPVDFPDISRVVCDDVRGGKADRGVMVCGTGVGASIAANKIPRIRAMVAHDTHCAHQGVEHDNVNVLCLGAQIIGPWLAEDIIEAFLKAEFRTEEHFRRRVAKLSEMEMAAARELLGNE
ncbi:MAG: RpiB/LacA/LacB family sugar-phosphate isomerase [Candidatus Poribacteria bacterium]|nr:RpiB/LacA/LacB family sugar-phosphate isomerase [Candidatus Poribacteria bacterium]